MGTTYSLTVYSDTDNQNTFFKVSNILENVNQSIMLISDDNFQLFGKQLNQFLLLEIKE